MKKSLKMMCLLAALILGVVNEKRKEHRSEHLSIVQSGALFLLRLDAE